MPDTDYVIKIIYLYCTLLANGGKKKLIYILNYITLVPTIV